MFNSSASCGLYGGEAEAPALPDAGPAGGRGTTEHVLLPFFPHTFEPVCDKMGSYLSLLAAEIADAEWELVCVLLLEL